MSFIPKIAISILRIPVAVAGTGYGLNVYFNNKLEQFSPSKVMSSYYDNTIDFIKDMQSINQSNSQPSSASTQDTIETQIPLSDASVASEKDTINNSVYQRGTLDSSIQSKRDIGDNNHLMGLTKKLIEIRNLLKKVSNNSSLELPSIVVIGSQSSGKSSVLEAIVGHEFLPKGSNMVTRRPIELTLIHSVNAEQEYSEFPQLRMGKVTDFGKVQKILTDLNLAVTDEECVSDNPIELKIFSPYVPDLTMVDLPGYIQVSTQTQPKVLKEKIIDLCEKYIQEPNIILAVCAADVDLANSEALRSSLRVDPLGMRTIGVVTKMDLVDPEVGNAILNNHDFPLTLGYVGVVNKMTNHADTSAMIRHESDFFKKRPIYEPSIVGSESLRLKLMKTLETHMARSLDHIVDAVGIELDDARYQFKVHYNDRIISAESYVAESMDALKHRFKEFTSQFDKNTVKASIIKMLEAKMLDITSEIYYLSPKINQLPQECMRSDNSEWEAKVNQASAKLTRSGVGKSSVQLVVDMISSKLEEITSIEEWRFHKSARQNVLQYASDLLRSKYHATIDSVENTIKPYKFEVDCSDLEWKDGQKRAIEVLDGQVLSTINELKSIQSKIGRRKLKKAIRYLDYLATTTPGENIKSTTLSPEAIQNARDMIESKAKLTILQYRIQALSSRQCQLQNKQCCPEAFLSVVIEKLASTAVMFINLELLNEFFFQLPREIDSKLYYSLGKDEIEMFCNENPSVSEHLRIQNRKIVLETVMAKLRDLKRY